MHHLTATLWLLASGQYHFILTSHDHDLDQRQKKVLCIRNVVRVEEALAEAYRVLKPGGR